MADMTRPAGEPAGDDGRAPVQDAAPAEPVADREPATTTADQTPEPAAETRVIEERTEAVPTSEPAAETRVIEERTEAVPTSEPAAETRVIDERTEVVPTPPPPPAEPEPLAPADDLLPPPPRIRSNRLVGAAWVLLAAGLFEVLFFAVNALVALVFGGSAAVVPQVQSIAGTSLAWLPVVLFFLLYLLTVLLVNRAGRVAYVFASLIVAVAVYVLTVILFSLIVRSSIGDVNTLAQTFLNWEFILVGLVARETMLWTGLAIGTRGIRMRRKNREERARYDQELADARA